VIIIIKELINTNKFEINKDNILLLLIYKNYIKYYAYKRSFHHKRKTSKNLNLIRKDFYQTIISALFGSIIPLLINLFHIKII
jgi:hypothetical protein